VVALAAVGVLLVPSRAAGVLLDVPLLKQCDAPWGTHALGTCTDTICSSGCAITSTTMVFAYFGGAMDPGELNGCLTSSGGYASGCLIYWDNACEPTGVTYAGGAATIDAELAAGRPVIVQVTNADTSMHFVVIVGNEGGDYQINDPGYSHTTISGGGYTIQGSHVYHGTHVEPQTDAGVQSDAATSQDGGGSDDASGAGDDGQARDDAGAGDAQPDGPGGASGATRGLEGGCGCRAAATPGAGALVIGIAFVVGSRTRRRARRTPAGRGTG